MRASMDRGAFIFEEADDIDALEGVAARAKGVSGASLSLDRVDEAIVEVKLGVVDRVDAVLAISE